MIIIILRAFATSVPITALVMIPTSIAAVQRIMAALVVGVAPSSSTTTIVAGACFFW
jgi:hypothetical protein